jgi:hypothetical protein
VNMPGTELNLIRSIGPNGTYSQPKVDTGSNRALDGPDRRGFIRRSDRNFFETLRDGNSGQGAEYRQTFSHSGRALKSTPASTMTAPRGYMPSSNR